MSTTKGQLLAELERIMDVTRSHTYLNDPTRMAERIQDIVGKIENMVNGLETCDKEPSYPEEPAEKFDGEGC